MTTTEVAALAEGLSKAQRELVSGRYDGDFARHEDAAALERAGLWRPVEPDEEDEFWRFEVTPLGLAVRNHLLASGGA